ncbi:phosphoenolpyruvate carboxylase [Limnobacter sp. MED105]|nr:phosphoenolpyruvate carboxylase [Limnobacter sp. MED105]
MSLSLLANGPTILGDAEPEPLLRKALLAADMATWALLWLVIARNMVRTPILIFGAMRIIREE